MFTESIFLLSSLPLQAQSCLQTTTDTSQLELLEDEQIEFTEEAPYTETPTPHETLQHVATGHGSHLQTYPVKKEKAPTAQPLLLSATLPLTALASEKEEIIGHGLSILTSLKQSHPSLFGDINPMEVMSAIGGINITQAIKLLKESPLSLYAKESTSLLTSLAEFLQFDQMQLLDFGQMNTILQLGLKVGIFAALNLVTWYGSGRVQNLFQNSVNGSKLSEGKKHFFTQANNVGRIAFIAMAAVLSYLIVGGDMTVVLATAGIGAVGFGIVMRQFFLDLANYMRIKSNQTYRVGNYISVDDKRGYVLYTNLTHTILLNFYDPNKVDLNAVDGTITKAESAQTETAKSENEDNDPELTTADFPDYIHISELAEGRKPFTRQIPNAYLLAEPVDHYESRDVRDKKDLEPYLALLRPKNKDEDNDQDNQRDDNNTSQGVTATASEQDPTLYYLDMVWGNG